MAEKMMYSLMLSSDIVAMIDQLAYRKGTNRSAMVNQILAEYVSYRTPEMRLREIFHCMEETLCMGDGFVRLGEPSDTVYSVRSALAYKYNPTLRYSVELYKTEGAQIGELRVSMRTRNTVLIEYLQSFYRAWMREESRAEGDIPYQIEGERFARALIPHTDAPQTRKDDRAVGSWIAHYVDAFDRALKFCFAHMDDAQTAVAGIRQIQEEYRRNNTVRV